MPTKEQNLYEALAVIGIEANADAGTRADQRRVWTMGDKIMGRFTADEGWTHLKEAFGIAYTQRKQESK